MQQQSADPFSDDVLMVIDRLARPIEPDLRVAFMTAVASELRRLKPDQVGAGQVARIGRELQREFRQAPRHLRDPKY